MSAAIYHGGRADNFTTYKHAYAHAHAYLEHPLRAFHGLDTVLEHTEVYLQSAELLTAGPQASSARTRTW